MPPPPPKRKINICRLVSVCLNIFEDRMFGHLCSKIPLNLTVFAGKI
jgi:hypothetical protein